MSVAILSSATVPVNCPAGIDVNDVPEPLNVVAVMIPEAYMFPSEPIPTPLLIPS